MCRNIFRTFSSSHPTDLGHIARTYREGIREGSFWHLRPHSDLRVSNRGLPKTGTLKINPKSVAYLSSLKMWLLNHHIHHANHHKFTTKTPCFGTRFCQNPQTKNGYPPHFKKSLQQCASSGNRRCEKHYPYARRRGGADHSFDFVSYRYILWTSNSGRNLFQT